MDSSHSGFTLIEVSIAMILMAGLTFGWLMTWAIDGLKAQSKFAGEQYRTVGRAVDSYLSLYHDQLQKLPHECSVTAYAESISLASSVSVAAGNCLAKLKSPRSPDTIISILNGLQPSVEELRSLYLLDAGFQNRLILPVEHKVAIPLHHRPSSTLAAAGYAVQIQKNCISTDCEKFQLTGYVFNTQPYLISRFRSFVSGHELLQDAWAAAGPDAMLSTHGSLGGSGELNSWGGGEVVPNPLRLFKSDGGSEGIPGILAVRVGYGSLSMGEFARLDGSRQITGSWNFGGQEVQGIKQLAAAAISAESLLVSGNAVMNSLLLKGDKGMTAAPLNVDGLVKAKQLAVSGSTKIDGSVQAGSLQTDAFVAKNVNVQGKANVRELVFDTNGKVLLPKAVIGQACDSTTQSLAISSDTSRFIICNATVGRWSPNP